MVATIFASQQPAFRGGGGSTSTFGIVANRFQFPTTRGAIAGDITTKRRHFATSQGDISSIQCLDIGWTYRTATEEALANSYTIKRYIEYPTGSQTFYQVTWAGQPTVTIAPGSQVVSDPIAGLTVPAGVAYDERTVALGTANQIPYIEQPTGSVALGISDGNATGDLGNSGTIPATTSTTRIGCIAMFGNIASPNARSFMLGGDSIMFGQGDTNSVGALQTSSYPQRTLAKYGFGNVKFGRGGQKAIDIQTTNTMLKAALAVIPFTEFWGEYGINDISTGGTLQATEDAITAIANFSIFSDKQRHWNTIAPRSTSTDGWVTEVNQSPAVDGNMAALNPLNAWIRGRPPWLNGQIIEVADIAMPSRDADIWSTNGNTITPTLDGTHPTSSGCIRLAANLTIT